MNHAQIIQALGGPRAVADAIGANERRVRGWRERSSIPAKYWPALVEISSSKSVDVTLEVLAGSVAAA